jgi:polyisoprenoid-binding protein YceI
VLKTLQRYRGGGVCAAVVLSLGVAGCGVRPPAPAQAVTTAGHAGTTPFQLDANDSEIRLFLQADGPLAKVGHNHVITSHGLRGTIWLHPQPQRSSCELQLPVASLVVDDPQERAAAGGEYAEPLDEPARAGTREHMLGDRQLDAAQFPLVTLQCLRLAPGTDTMTVELTVTLRDHVSQLSVPVKWQRSGNTLQADGEITVTQTSLGLQPYSLLLGALRVSDEIRARFRIVARTT